MNLDSLRTKISITNLWAIPKHNFVLLGNMRVFMVITFCLSFQLSLYKLFLVSQVGLTRVRTIEAELGLLICDYLSLQHAHKNCLRYGFFFFLFLRNRIFFFPISDIFPDDSKNVRTSQENVQKASSQTDYGSSQSVFLTVKHQ